MSEYYMSHTGAELDDAINKVRTGYVFPSETIDITANISGRDITNGKILNVNVPQGYTKSKHITFTTTAASGVIKVTGIGFKPKTVAAVLYTDVTLAHQIVCSFIWDEKLETKCNATSSAAGRILTFGGSLGLTVNNDGFTTNSTYGTFKSGVTYDIFCWG